MNLHPLKGTSCQNGENLTGWSGHSWLNKMLLLKEEGAKGVNSDTEVQSAQHQLYPFVRCDSKHFLTIHYWSVWQFKAKNSLVLSFVTTIIYLKTFEMKTTFNSILNTYMDEMQLYTGARWADMELVKCFSESFTFHLFHDLHLYIAYIELWVSYKSLEYG